MLGVRWQLLFLQWFLLILKLGTQPAHMALGFFFRALGIELHQMREDVVGAGRSRQAIGGQHGGVHFVVQFDTHQAVDRDGLFFGGEGSALAQWLAPT